MTEHEVQHDVIIEAKGISKDFTVGKNIIHALKNIDLEVRATDFIVIFGPSGCGKSTLFNTLLGLEKPTKGEVIVRDTKIYDMDEDDRAKFRSKKIGMVYQMPYWIKSLNVLENVAFPLIIEGLKEKDAKEHAKRVLAELDISSLSKQKPTQLSGGQQQRVGLARALVSKPWIIMADEPTGNLDTTNSDEVMSILNTLNTTMKKTILMVTHNPAYWSLGTRRIEMKDGEITKDTSK